MRARGVSVVPGAIVCPDYNTVRSMFDRYVAHWTDLQQDALTNGQARLLRGQPTSAPDLGVYGCALLPSGTPMMMMERGNVIPVVTAKLADGTTIRGVTLPAMIGEAAEASQSNVQPPQPRTDTQPDSGPDEAKEIANVQRLEPIVAQARACIRSNIPTAYQSGVYGGDQAIAFFKARCFDPYSAAFRQLGFSELTDSGFNVLVIQEAAPEQWQKVLDDLKSSAH